MTETTTEAVAAPAATAPEQPPPQTTEPTLTPTELPHTPGGLPVVPLAVTSANSMVGLVATAGLAAGPIAAVVAAGGAAALGTAAAVRSTRTPAHRRATRRAKQARTASKSQASGRKSSSLRSGKRSASSGMPTGGSAGTRRAGRSSTPGRASKGAGKAPGRVGQVKALRAAKKAQAPTRSANRQHTAGARRSVADSRRAAKAATRAGKLANRGRAGRALTRGLSKAARRRDAASGKSRAARDARTREQLEAKRDAVRKAPARARARRALWRSAARYHGRRLLAAALAGAVGVVGMVSTPLGRKLGARWMQYPGRRLYRRMTATALQRRMERDEDIRALLRAEEEAADKAAGGQGAIGDKAERPTHLIPTAPSLISEGDIVGFNFEEAAAEMESAAGSYEPDGCMEILAMVEKLPEALTSVANTMKILAERSDEEFPLEKPVAAGFNEIFEALQHAVSAAEDLGPAFRQAHEADIARHEDPRGGGPEAEKGWNV